MQHSIHGHQLTNDTCDFETRLLHMLLVQFDALAGKVQLDALVGKRMASPFQMGVHGGGGGGGAHEQKGRFCGGTDAQGSNGPKVIHSGGDKVHIDHVAIACFRSGHCDGVQRGVHQCHVACIVRTQMICPKIKEKRYERSELQGEIQ